MTLSSSTPSPPASPSDTEITMHREFDAPRELVFRAYTDPDLIARWWGPRKYETIVEKLDLRPGGGWRFIHRAADGETAFRGVYREVVVPVRLVQTFEWEGMPGHVSVETAEFAELPGGRTRVSFTVRFASKEDMDGAMTSGMEAGWLETLERLTELLSSLQE